jgi:hypothetical protein
MRRKLGGRIAVDRRGVAALTGAAYSTVNHWHRQRTHTGFPEGFQDEDGHELFWLQDIESFHAAHVAAKKAELTSVDRTGDPDELVTSGTAAKILGYRSYRNLPDALLDAADNTERLPSGRVRRRWRRRTVWAIADARTGRQSTGRTPGSTTGTRKPHPYADDPRLDVACEVLSAAGDPPDHRRVALAVAERLGVSPRTAQRLIAVAIEQR